jgi:hypothetical protein
MNNSCAVFWQRRYSAKLPDGGMARWEEISEAEYEARRFDYHGQYEYRALGVLNGSGNP